MKKIAPKNRLVTAVIGGQWGDEGKGKLIDILAPKYDIIVRANGGANAGHTVYFREKDKTQKMVFHLIPSGIIHRNTICLIGNGCVVHLPTLFSEIEDLKKLNVSIKNRLLISSRAHLLFEYHKRIDGLQESLKKDAKIGTTLRGIGPCYSDKVNRIGIRLGEILNFPDFEKKVRANLTMHEKLYGKMEIDIDKELKEYQQLSKKIKPLIVESPEFLDSNLRKGKKIILEGANGVMLDLDHGTYPFVTSSNPTIGGLITGSAIPATAIEKVIGIFKAYVSRVGSGPFPTELHNQLGDAIREKGGEYGSTTGRSRRCGWFDAILARYAIEINGIDTINLTKLDVLSGLKELKIAISYVYNSKKIATVPESAEIMSEIKVNYLSLPGWEEDISAITSFKRLPKNCRAYVEKLQELLKTPVKYIGVGVRRDQIIER